MRLWSSFLSPAPLPPKNTKVSSLKETYSSLWLEIRKGYCVKNFHLRQNSEDGTPSWKKAASPLSQGQRLGMCRGLQVQVGGGCVVWRHSVLCLWDRMDCSPPGSSVHGILQTRTLEWVAVQSSRGPSPPRDRAHISCTGGRVLTIWTTSDAHLGVGVPHESRKGDAAVCPVPGQPRGSRPLLQGVRKQHPSGKSQQCFPGGREVDSWAGRTDEGTRSQTGISLREEDRQAPGWKFTVSHPSIRLQCGRPGFDPRVGTIPWRRSW